MKTILHIISGLESGGAEGALYRLVVNDDKHSHKVVSLTSGGVYYSKLIDVSIGVDTINMSRARITVRGVYRLYKIIREMSPDVVQTWMYHSDLLGGILARISGVNSVVWGIRGPYNRKRTSLSTKIVVYSCMLLSRCIPKSIVSNSHFARNAHIDIGYSDKKFRVIPNGYELKPLMLSHQKRVEFYKKYQIETNTLVLGMVARFDPHKDYNNLLSALRKLQSRNLNFICLLVGSGMDEENGELLSLLKKYELISNVCLLGRSDSVSQLMSLLDLHILSSAAESFPNVLAEAMLMGTPCVTTDVGDAAIIVDDTGWVVPAESPDLLADAVEEAYVEMKNRTLWQKRQQMCKNRIEENYSLEKMIYAYHDVWEEAIGG